MKKGLLLLLLLPVAILVFTPQNARASHLRGGEITMSLISGNTYMIGAAFYRDTAGVTMGSSVFDIEEVGGTWSTAVTIPVPPPINLGNGVERYNFIDTITLPNAGEFEISAYNCCRNAAILNMSSPSGELMTLYSTLTIPATGVNSTPLFLNDPVTLAQVNTPWNYNPIPYDADGDSLYYSLVTPMGATNPVMGYTLPAGSAPFVLDQLTGGISWTPNALGAYASAVLVEEFRNGVKIGQIVRDMQIIVVPSGQNFNRAEFTGTGSWPTNSNGNFQFQMPVNSAFNLTITSNDPDGNPLLMEAIGEPLILANNPATFSGLYDPNTNTATGTFSWTPDNSQLRNNPYLIAVRTTEYVNGLGLAEDLSILLQTTNATGRIPDMEGEAITFFPNPARESVNLSFDLATASQVSVKIFDLSGKQVALLADQRFPAGTNLLHHEGLNLQAGAYLMTLEGVAPQPVVKRLIIQ